MNWFVYGCETVEGSNELATTALLVNTFFSFSQETLSHFFGGVIEKKNCTLRLDHFDGLEKALQARRSNRFSHNACADPSLIFLPKRICFDNHKRLFHRKKRKNTPC